MSDKLHQLADNFWSIRGAFRIAGVVNIGTHASLIRLGTGRFVFLDAYTLKGRVCKQVMALTEEGTLVDAILNLHPFHTVHCEQMHKDFPAAKLYGSTRHKSKFPNLPWDATSIDNPALAELFSGDFEFSIPQGVDFISANENIHFSSVLAYHTPSQTIHADDTFMFVPLPKPIKGPLKMLGAPSRIGFHPTLAQALEKRPGAAQDFRDWALALAENWGDATNLCAAHMGNYKAAKPGEIGNQIKGALKRVERTLASHEKKH
ncbi:MAG: hypothetical protein ACPG06_08425 [Alphaproteobacteria bacterium]